MWQRRRPPLWTTRTQVGLFTFRQVHGILGMSAPPAMPTPIKEKLWMGHGASRLMVLSYRLGADILDPAIQQAMTNRTCLSILLLPVSLATVGERFT